jgi:hypothetical protein
MHNSFAKARIRSSQSFLDGLVGAAVLHSEQRIIALTLSEEAPQADLEIGDVIYIPVTNITFLQDLEAR